MFEKIFKDSILIAKIYLEKNSHKIVYNLQQEKSKFMLDRGASKNVELTSSHYWKSLLFQGGLEIRCKISIKTGFSFSKAAFQLFKDKMRKLYTEPMEKIVGIILTKGNYPDTFAKELRKN